MRDLRPAARAMSDVVTSLPDDLDGPTPSPGYRVADLVEHVAGFVAGFTIAAQKQSAPTDAPPRPGDGSFLEVDWRAGIPVAVLALAEAWDEPSAWVGETEAGGIRLPAEAAGMFALDELVVHGWELARAADLPFDPPADDVDALIAFLSSQPRNPELFSDPVPVAADAAPLDRLIGLTGRDPAWTPRG